MTYKKKQHNLNVTDENDEAAAWDAFRSLVSKLNGAAPAQLAVRPEPCAAIVAEYLEAIAHKVIPRTKKGYESYLRRFVARFGIVQPALVDAAAVEKDAAAEDWSDSNRANYLWAVQAFIRWCGATGFKLSRPAKESRGAEAVIGEESHRLILREATGDFHELCRLLYAVGCRPMEGARLTAEGVDWASGTATLKQHKMRRKGKPRVLYLSTEALAILRQQADRYKNEGFLFRGMRGMPFSLRAIVGRFLRISEKIGRSVTAYGYRHAYATRALEQGVPDTHVAALLGHCSTAMVHKHYSHVTSNARLLKSVADQIGQSAPKPTVT